MQRRADGWHLELLAFGGSGAHADERVAAVGGVKELRQVPLKRDGWERRDFALALDAKAGHERLPIVVRAGTLPGSWRSADSKISTARVGCPCAIRSRARLTRGLIQRGASRRLSR